MNISSSHTHYRSRLEDADNWVRILGRIGLSAMAAVNLCIGLLALRLAMGERQTDVGKDSALSMIAQQPFGQILLHVVGIGLIVFAIYRIVGAIKDIDAKGKGAKGIGARIAFAASGLVYGALGASAIGVTWLSGSGGAQSGGGGNQQERTAELLSMPFGRILVGGIGAILVGYALYQMYRALSRHFFRKFKTERMSAKAFKLVKNTGTAGLLAKGAVVAIIGGFFLQAAISERANQSGSLAEALSWIIRQPFGTILLYAVAVGLILYGVYVFLKARYRHFARGPASA